MNVLGDNPTIWVFGYGSLLWKPDFQFKSKKIGYIQDFERRFYQGNETFRGKPGQPGRVANLIDKKGSQAWGVAYEICGREEVLKVLQNLYTREAACGGYVTMVTTFYPKDEQQEKRVSPSSRTIPSTVKSDFRKVDNITDSESAYSLRPELTRIDSEGSLDGLSSDEEEDVEVRGEYGQTAGNFRSSERESFRKLPIKNTDSYKDNHKSDNHLMQFLHKAGNTKTKQLLIDIENADHSYHESLSLSDHSSQPRGLLAADIEDSMSTFSIQVLLYTATPDNDLYLGPADVTTMARQIVSASGSAGSNVEYVTKTADFVRKYIPEDHDSHLFALDAKVREEVYRQHAEGSLRLQLGFADLSRDLHDTDHDLIAEPVMAS